MNTDIWVPERTLGSRPEPGDVAVTSYSYGYPARETTVRKGVGKEQFQMTKTKAMSGTQEH